MSHLPSKYALLLDYSIRGIPVRIMRGCRRCYSASAKQISHKDLRDTWYFCHADVFVEVKCAIIEVGLTERTESLSNLKVSVVLMSPLEMPALHTL